ncbi:DUF3560 domain-containing protein [Rothia sp. AR01]|uniref:DUF3560 domain-containing protein n=1 Tax=Rothia santali TaxID=2949643 RepID=A0A9X2HG87_9MICC|nr:DUF3560 domain-containing protein [Rothia santali]MCP3425146.1 DUF3560 domain-containing protein [Rothia santali]
MITITHTHEAGTIIEGTAKGDGTATVLKAHRYRWGRSIPAWYLPHSRDARPNTYRITRLVTALEEAGFTVAQELDHTVRSAAEVEAAKTQRAADRAEALQAKAERKHADAETAQARNREALDRLPEGGEPIKIGHHSENRHRRAIDTAHRRMGQAIEAETAAEEAERRAEIAAKATARRYSPFQVAGRIEKAERQIRRIWRILDGHTTESGTPYARQVPAATGERREYALSLLAEQEDHLSYWQDIRAQQIAEGKTGDYSRENIGKGDAVKVNGSWWKVARANPKTVTLYMDAEREVTSTYRPGYAKITDHRSAEQLAAALQ